MTAAQRRAPWSAVLFDLDGTVADSIELILHCFRHTIRTHYGTAPDEARWLASLGRPLRVQFAEFARSAEEADRLVETYVAHQRAVHDQFVRPYPGIDEMLAGLAGRGVKLGIVTSKRREMATRTLRVCGIERWFGILITPEDVLRPKPDAEPVLAALSGLGHPDRARVLMVGDAPVDVLAGRAAGVRTGAALWGPFPRRALEEAGADYFFEAPAAVLALEP